MKWRSEYYHTELEFGQPGLYRKSTGKGRFNGKPDAEYHLSFRTTQADKSHGAYQEMAEVQKYEGTVRKQMQEGLTDTEEMRAIKEIRQKYKAYYTEQMEKLHQEQAEEVMQGGAVPDDEQIHNLLERRRAGKRTDRAGKCTLNIFLYRSRAG